MNPSGGKCVRQLFQYTRGFNISMKCPNKQNAAAYMLPKISPCTRNFESVPPAAKLSDSFTKSNTTASVEDYGDIFGKIKVPLERVKAKGKKRMKKEFREEKVTQSSEQFLKNEETTSFNRRQKDRKMKVPYKVYDRADTFGNLSKGSPVWFSPVSLQQEEEEDLEPGDDSRVEFPVEKTFKNARLYLNEMKRLVQDKRLKEALELIPDMYRNHVFPIHSNYTFLIGACGRAGYTEMAFKLFRQMSDRGFRPTCAVLTGLFNSCAESPFPDYGLQKAAKLRKRVTEKNYTMNRTSYHAMIKAFGKCGDIGTAFEIVDEMIDNGIGVAQKTYSFLFVACIADKDAGFTHAIEVWRKIMSKRLQPDIYIFNLLLRAVRDCGIGPEEVSCLLLQHWSSFSKRPYGLNAPSAIDNSDLLKLPNPEFLDVKLLASSEGSASNSKSEDTEGSRQRTEITLRSNSETGLRVDLRDICTNILMQRPLHGPEFVELSNIKTASDRLALVGNADGFLKLMKKHQVKPDIKTFTLLLECLPPSTQHEEELLSFFAVYKLHPDTDFFNMLIKRRNVRHDFMAAKNVLSLLNRQNLNPDIVTFGVLALGCRSVKQGNFLLQDMKNFGVTPNVEILGALITSATNMMDFDYLSHLLKVMRVESIHPNERILAKIEVMLETAHDAILQKEQGKLIERFFLDENFSKNLQSFKSYYADWLRVMKVEAIEHPWDQYKTDIRLRKQITN